MKSKLFAGMLVSILMIFAIDVMAQKANNLNDIFPVEEVKHGMTGYGFSDLGPDVSNIELELW